MRERDAHTSKSFCALQLRKKQANPDDRKITPLTQIELRTPNYTTDFKNSPDFETILGNLFTAKPRKHPARTCNINCNCTKNIKSQTKPANIE